MLASLLGQSSGARMAMIDSILETARRLQMDRFPRQLEDLRRSFMRDHPETAVGRDSARFDATVNSHTINMPSRFPDPRNLRAPANGQRPPIVKRIALRE